MVIGFTSKDGHCAVYLLDGHYSYHLVREGKFAERPLSVSSRVELLAESERSSDDEGEIPSGIHLLLQPVGEFDRSELLSPFIQQDDIHRRCETREDGCVILTLRHDDELKGHIVLESILVFVYEGLDTRVGGLADHKERDFHSNQDSYEL